MQKQTSKSTHTSEVLIQQLHIAVDQLKGQEFIVVILYSTAKVQTGISVMKHSQMIEPQGN